MLFEESPKFKSKTGRKLFRESAEKPMSTGQKAKFKRYMERELGGKKEVSTREFRIAEKKAMKRFSVERGAYAQKPPPSAAAEPPKRGDMLRDKITREKMPPTLEQAAYQSKQPPKSFSNPALNKLKAPLPKTIQEIIEHRPPAKKDKPPKDS